MTPDLTPRSPRVIGSWVAGLVLVTGLVAGCVSGPPVAGPDDRISGWSGGSPSSETSADPSECEYVKTDNASRPVDLPPMTGIAHTGTAVATITTDEGPMVLTLDREAAPCTVNSFLSLAKQKFYDNTQCHRLIDSGSFLLQCGDPAGDGRGGPGYVFADELTGEVTYPAGTVAMANSGADTNGSQFFLVFGESPLPPNYTVFGRFDEASLAILVRIVVEGHDGRYEQGGSGKPHASAKILTIAEGGKPGSPIPSATSSGR